MLCLTVLFFAVAASAQRSRLEDVRFETMLLEKQLEFALLDLQELRARHERDMRAYAVAAAEDLTNEEVEQPSLSSTKGDFEPRPRERRPGRRRPGRRRKQQQPPEVATSDNNTMRVVAFPKKAAELPELPYMRRGDAPRRRIEVVVWNKIRGFLDWLRPDFVTSARERCSTECVFTGNQRAVPRADGVVFHAKTHRVTDFPPKRPPGAKYMLVSLEQEKYAPLLKHPKYVAKFDAIMTYALDSTLPMISVHPHWDAARYYEAPTLGWETKLDAAVAFVSNCRNAGAADRLAFLEKLMKVYAVHSYGRCLHNKDEPPLRDGQQRGDAKRALLAKYKFYLSFENDVNSKDYVSEKVYDGFLAATLPVYRGTATIDRLVPAPDALVKTADFGDDPARLAHHLAHLAANKSAYDAYFAWRKPPRDTPRARARFQTIIDMTAYKYTALCRICAYLADHQPAQA
ncbi:hypothetical protein CTAYLR_005728 [Chrysophaeum taylorii]|uniref:Fucosyltransferase n=1 Tax=Chrysophaeum taylorii TaxID=2483200 RepID=A0AAD7UL72_9STRA|nr:hypothetical protein CTAYLR_005728 [Chrysophaeum taylorii]